MNRRNLYWLLYVLFVFSCAKQTAPTGGPKDTIPPTLKSSFPAKSQTSVQPTEIKLLFDETVVLNNPKEQLIVTPDIGKDYEIKARKKEVTLNLRQPLRANTTYSFNFRDAVQDINEKNPVNNLKIAFSTGTFIDSLSIEGTITDLIQNKELKDATVALYQSDTINIFTHKPLYFTKADQKGYFRIDNLKNDTFYIYAFDDKNRNLLVDSRTENYGYNTTPIILNQNTKNQNIKLIRLDARPLRMQSSRPYNTYYNIRFTKGLSAFAITTPANDSIVSTFGDDRSNIRVYNTFANQDSIQVILTARDSINNQVDTTFYLKFSANKTTPEKFSVSTDQLKAISKRGRIEIKGRFTKPIFEINYDSIKFIADSINQFPLKPHEISVDNKTKSFSINKIIPKEHLHAVQKTRNPIGQPPPPPTKSNILYFGKASFISVEFDSSATAEHPIKPLGDEDTSIITYEIETSNKNFIVELLNKNYERIAHALNTRKGTFQDLLPGDYYLRVIHDIDANGQWSPGSFLQKIPPEPIHYYYETKKKTNLISLKANWELGPLLIKF
jgi:hypothetical protein